MCNISRLFIMNIVIVAARTKVQFPPGDNKAYLIFHLIST